MFGFRPDGTEATKYAGTSFLDVAIDGRSGQIYALSGAGDGKGILTTCKADGAPIGPTINGLSQCRKIRNSLGPRRARHCLPSSVT